MRRHNRTFSEHEYCRGSIFNLSIFITHVLIVLFCYVILCMLLYKNSTKLCSNKIMQLRSHQKTLSGTPFLLEHFIKFFTLLMILTGDRRHQNKPKERETRNEGYSQMLRYDRESCRVHRDPKQRLLREQPMIYHIIDIFL